MRLFVIFTRKFAQSLQHLPKKTYM